MSTFHRPLLTAALFVIASMASNAAPPAAPAAASSNYDESKVAPYTLPDLFTLADGGKVTTSAMWEGQRRRELLEIFRREIYGFAPPKPETQAFRVETSDPLAMEGKATRKHVAVSFQLGGETFSFHVILFVPNQRTAPAPVFLLLNHRPISNTDPTRQTRSDFWPAEQVIARGYAIAAINVSAEVEPDKRDATTGVRAFYRQHFAKPDELTWGALAAWAWAGSRALDYFATDADVNAAQVAVIGHSRTGKTALWAAAEDTRFALACANGAGEGGPALARRNFGETLGQITTSFPYWFTAKYATYADRVDTLPIDQHELVALVAPRGYHGGDGTRDTWADPRGSWLSLVEASKVWAMSGQTAAWQGEMPPVNELRMDGPLAYHIHEGGHDLTALDWKLYLDHADQLFRAPRRGGRGTRWRFLGCRKDAGAGRVLGLWQSAGRAARFDRHAGETSAGGSRRADRAGRGRAVFRSRGGVERAAVFSYSVCGNRRSEYLGEGRAGEHVCRRADRESQAEPDHRGHVERGAGEGR